MPVTENLPALPLLERRLASAGGRFTLTDAAASTGLPVTDARQALDALMSRYICRLQATDSGDLIYDFGTALRRRGEKTRAERIQEFKDLAWRAFTIFYKAWITVTLVVYFVIFLLLLIFIVIAALSSNKDNDNNNDRSDNSGGSSFSFFTVGRLFGSIFSWNTHTGQVYYDRDERGYSSRRYEPTPSPLARRGKTPPEKKNFVASVYDFVFGPQRVETSPLANQQEVAAYVRQQQGLVVTSELQALAGWDSAQAEQFFSDCLVRFNGEAKISPNGVLYGDFYELTRRVTTEADAPVVWYWDEYEPPYALTGNSAWRNTAIIFLNGFNLLFSMLISLGFLGGLVGHGTLATVWLGVVPLLFSLIFFAVPLLRRVQLGRQQARQRLQNVRKRLMKAIFGNRDRPITLDALTKTVNATAQGEEALPPATVESTLQILVRDLGGEVAPTDEGKVVYTFPKLRTDMDEVKVMRQQRTLESPGKTPGTNLGNVIMDVGGEI